MQIPWSLLFVGGGASVVFLTEHNTLGFVLIGIGLFPIALALVVVGIAGLAILSQQRRATRVVKQLRR